MPRSCRNAGRRAKRRAAVCLLSGRLWNIASEPYLRVRVTWTMLLLQLSASRARPQKALFFFEKKNQKTFAI
jgi:hypothetical protein